jgi:signal peptidase II|tara:strand:+ start:69 stop:569 length:501 start_codon:yes stop_codon:yes gene_type:complete
MKKLSLKKLLIYFLIVNFIFFLDRITKIYILNLAEMNGSIDIFVNNFLNIILVWNSGIGFGLLSFEKDFIYNLITSLIIFINIIIVYLAINSNNSKSYFFVMILGGSLGNLFDRIYYSAVPDFIDLNYNNFHWFVFNVADIFITIGILCLIFVELFFNKRELDNER